MSRWQHSICDTCWQRREPDREPIRLRDAKPETCCFCGAEHESGIYVRENWAFLLCRGETGIHAVAAEAAKGA